MTRDGRIKPLTRFGVHREPGNALSRCTYEETHDVLAGAAIYADSAPVRGVSTSIMLGMRACIGSGATTVRLHTDMIPTDMHGSLARTPRVTKSRVHPANRENIEPARYEYVVAQSELDACKPHANEMSESSDARSAVVSICETTDGALSAENGEWHAGNTPFAFHSPECSSASDDDASRAEEQEEEEGRNDAAPRKRKRSR